MAFLVATAAHAGFQLTVTALVYPALVRVGPEGWQQAHTRHSRAILPLVVLVYGALLVTATASAPTHRRLVTPEPHLLRRLLVVDRVRAGLACLAFAG